jgi:uncharacterized membrane protein YagU involved in acid resistance
MLLLPSFKWNDETTPQSQVFPIVLFAFIVGIGLGTSTLKWLVGLLIPETTAFDTITTINTAINTLGFVIGATAAWYTYRAMNTSGEIHIEDDEESADEANTGLQK